MSTCSLCRALQSRTRCPIARRRCDPSPTLQRGCRGICTQRDAGTIILLDARRQGHHRHPPQITGKPAPGSGSAELHLEFIIEPWTGLVDSLCPRVRSRPGDGTTADFLWVYVVGRSDSCILSFKLSRSRNSISTSDLSVFST